MEEKSTGLGPGLKDAGELRRRSRPRELRRVSRALSVRSSELDEFDMVSILWGYIGQEFVSITSLAAGF